MISLVLGVAAAGCWGVQNVLMARSARQVSPASVTAVFATQFASVAALGGLIAFGERLSRRQLLGFIALVIGVSLVAGGA